jgi:hypothetical protein
LTVIDSGKITLNTPVTYGLLKLSNVSRGWYPDGDYPELEWGVVRGTPSRFFKRFRNENIDTVGTTL